MSARKRPNLRDGSRFIALPHVVIASVGYRRASHLARSLLVDLALQLGPANNGRLTATRSYFEKLGWRSNASITKARRELEELGLIQCTRVGSINRPSWYALSWVSLGHTTGLDIDPKKFRTGLYLSPEKIDASTPRDGAGKPLIGPPRGAGQSTAAPPRGSIKGLNEHSCAPPNGHYLEMPSTQGATQ